MMMSSKGTWVLLACLCIGMAGLFLLSGNYAVPLLDESVKPASPLSPTPLLRAEILGLPGIIYVGENLSYLVHVENASQTPQTFRIVHTDPWGRQEQTVALAPNGSADVPFVLCVASPAAAATATVNICPAGDPTRVLWQKVFHFRDGQGDLTDIVAAGRACSDAKGEPFVLVNRYENETEYRRWAPVKWMVREWQRRGAPVILSAPNGFLSDSACLPKDWTFIPYGGDSVAACLRIDSQIPVSGPVLVCLAWGFDEAIGGLPARDCARALDLAIDRIRKRNPAAQIVLVTPPPSPALPDACARFAEAIRTLAREHHTQIIDLAAGTLREKDWQRLYSLDDDANLMCLYPKAEGLGAWAECLKRGIVNREGFVIDSGVQQSHLVPANGCTEATSHAASANVNAQFPGIATIIRPVSFSNPAKAVLADVLVPSDAPRTLQLSLFVKDKDGLWFQSASVSRLPAGKWQTVRFDLDPCAGLLSARGHEGAWNAYYAGHVTQTGLQFFAPASWKGSIQVGDIRAADSKPASPEPLRILSFQQLTPMPKAYEVTEFSFDLSMPGTNPFNPRHCNTQVAIRAPSGREMRVNGFYHQPYARSLNVNGEEVISPVDKGSWRVRFTPLESGRHEWRLTAEVGTESVETRWHSLEVEAAPPHGFVRVSDKDPRYFETADGTFFYPIGQNIHAPTDARSAKMMQVPILRNRGTYAYDDYFARMAANGENAAIVWMSNWWVSIEWTKRWKGFNGLGDYNLGNAWRLDYLLDAAARHGIHVLLVLDNHGKFSTYVDSEWETNPYNAELGGPCRSPEEFIEDDQAFEFYKRRLRYIVARWGCHPNLLGFELVSELNLVGSSAAYRRNPAHVAWLKKTARYLEEIDPYSRPITVQYSTDYQSVDPAVASLKELSFIVGDVYKPGGAIVDLMLKTADSNGQFGKPTFSAEFGGNWNGTTPARLHADLHAGLWSNAMTTAAGTPFIWWFDFIDRYGLYREFSALAKFMHGEDRRRFAGCTVAATVLADGRESPDVRAVALAGEDRAYFWVYDTLAAEIMPEEKFAREHAALALEIPGLADGSYQVEYWSTASGTRLRTERVTVEQGRLSLDLPTFKVDLAGKIRRSTP